MLSDHLRALLREASSVSVVVDNAKTHHEHIDCSSTSSDDEEDDMCSRRSCPKCTRSDPLPLRRPRQRSRPSRWESEPSSLAAASMKCSSLMSPPRRTSYVVTKDSTNHPIVHRDRPPVLKYRTPSSTVDRVHDLSSYPSASSSPRSSTSSKGSGKYNDTSSLCSLQRNAALPLRPGAMESKFVASLHAKAVPLVVNHDIQHLSTANLLTIALNDITIHDTV